jgi:16S rRNA (cytidine1402-2'-O)-methyltransferase
MAGTLYLVATPIGNLEDMTYRAVRILGEVDMVAAEDTRQTLKLLNRFEIKKPMLIYHEHNKREMGEKIIALLQEGKNIALATDAGTPGISDPGEDLVKLAVENNIEVFLLPGATASIYALVVSGLSTSRFIFEGFLPRENKEKRESLEKIKEEERTMIFYEAPHRLRKTLESLYETLGDRKIALCRELTKKHEEVQRVRLSEAIETYKSKEPRGEYVLVVEGKSLEEIEAENAERLSEITIEDHIKMYVDSGMSKKDAVKKVAKERNLPKSEVYKYSIEIEG